VRIIDEQEQVVLDRRVDTTCGEFDRLFAGRARMRILIESSTESPPPNLESMERDRIGSAEAVASEAMAALSGRYIELNIISSTSTWKNHGQRDSLTPRVPAAAR
jgi:hypothetical protein